MAVCLLLLGSLLSGLTGCGEPEQRTEQYIQALSDDYIKGWMAFYPTRALSAGSAEEASKLEDYSLERIGEWVAFNRRMLGRLQAAPPPASLDDRIDVRLLVNQVNQELNRWDESGRYKRDPLMYAGLVNHALTPLLVRDTLSPARKIEAVINRLENIGTEFCQSARNNLEDGRPAATASAIRQVRSTARFIRNGLVAAMGDTSLEDQRRLEDVCNRTAEQLNAFARYLEEDLSPGLTLKDAYGEELYTRELALSADPGMTPERLEKTAMAEIQTVRGLMEQLARLYWAETRTTPVPVDFSQLIDPVLADMEANRASDQRDFLRIFLDLIDRSEQFLARNDLITLPAARSLFTALSPSHFAGAAVGGVYSSGPFNPEADTLFYLPTIPDSAPEEARDGFYRSFNNHFNIMIITHEIYPGHYLQLKTAAYHPRRVRALFSGNTFTEGWASFCEQMMLDQGWDSDNHLTRLAHLRKRLENAVRAYVSVQVHCRGWQREQVHRFSVETGLLPPQFAENLWDRALHSPIQLTSYFIGFQRFSRLYLSEKARLGEEFQLKAFNDAIVQSGGMPLEMLEEYLEEEGR